MASEHIENSVRVLVVDDQQLMRDGMASLLNIQPGIEVVGTAADGQQAVEQVQKLSPDIVLMDVRMPVMDGIAATQQIRREYPTCQILMLSTFDDEEYIIKALIAGASGYLLKDIPAPDLAHAVQLAHKGIYQLEPSIAGKLVGALSQPASSAPITTSHPSPVDDILDLTDRELDVLKLIATGATNKEIAQELIISEGTVKNHVSNILNCLGLRDRTQAAIYAHEKNLV
jgi:DNA-binding NarL/FixJ family response regulator